MAEKMAKRESIIRLSKEEWDRLTKALERPAREPSAATKRAVATYRKGKKLVCKGEEKV